MDKYQPSDTIKQWRDSGRLYPLKGLAGWVSDARAAGWTVAVDLGDGEPDMYEVTGQDVRMAVSEVEAADLYFTKEGERRQWLWVIPSNDEDWCSDYTVHPFMEEMFCKHVGI